jgi:hypothetical protein
MKLGDLGEGSRLDTLPEQGFDLCLWRGGIGTLGLVALNGAGMPNAAFLGFLEGDWLMRKDSRKAPESLLTSALIP